jgi:hypothetical protein
MPRSRRTRWKRGGLTICSETRWSSGGYRPRPTDGERPNRLNSGQDATKPTLGLRSHRGPAATQRRGHTVIRHLPTDLDDAGRRRDVEDPRWRHGEDKVAPVHDDPHADDGLRWAGDRGDQGAARNARLDFPSISVRDSVPAGGEHGLEDLDTGILDLRPWDRGDQAVRELVEGERWQGGHRLTSMSQVRASSVEPPCRIAAWLRDGR